MVVDTSGLYLYYCHILHCLIYSPKPRDVEADAHIEGNLAAEVSMVALDTLELIIQVGIS